MATDWYESEKARHSLKRELQRLKRRARSRPALLLALALGMTLAVLWYKERSKPPYRAYVSIRVTEGNLLREDSPLAGHDLDEYLKSVALSNQQISEILDEHDLYELERARGEIFAIATLRDNMKLSIFSNYFAVRRSYSDAPRSARISIRFQDKDPELAFAVAQDLATKMVENEQRRRNASAERLHQIAELAYRRAQTEALELKSRLTRKRLELDEAEKKKATGDEIAALRVEVGRLAALTERALDMLSKTEGQRSSINFALAADAADLGLRFEIVDKRPPIPRDPVSPFALGMWGLAIFVIVLPLSAIAVGAFDSRLHEGEDIERLGLPLVGQVPTFPGAERGSLRERIRQARVGG